jgi:chromosomal replication initiator protein
MNTNNIIKTVATIFGTTPEDIKGKRRTKPIADARAVCFFFMRKTGMTVENIGEKLNRHHTTVVLGTKKVESLLSFDKAFINQFEQVELMLDKVPKLKEVA